MTGLQHEREFSRRSFIKGGGALVVGFSLAGSGLAGKASAAIPTPAGYLPDPNQVDSWLTIGADNTATLKTSQIETGNGIMTGFLMVAAEELDMDLGQMRYGRDDTYIVVASGGEGGSNAIAGTAPPIRAAAVSARQALLGLASAQFGVPAASLTVSKGVISGGGFQSTYGELLGGKLFNVSMPPSYNMAEVGGFGPPTGLVAGQAPAKAIASYKLVGTSPPRIDIPGKVTGTYTYVQNVRVAGMMHGRVVRPRGQGAWGAGATILSVDPSSISHIPNVQVVQKGNFLGVVAPEEWNAIQAAAQLKVTWKDDPILPGSGNQFTRDEGGDDPRRGADELRRPRCGARLRGEDARCQLLLPLQRASADRADVLRRRRHAGPDDDLLAAPRTSKASRTPSRASSASPRTRFASSTTRARAPTARTRRRTSPSRRRSCRRRSASRCASSSCAGTSTAGTTTAPSTPST